MHLRSRGKESCMQRLKDVTRRTASLSGWRGWPPVYAWLTFFRVNEWVRSKREACCSASVVIMAAARAIPSVHSWVFLEREREMHRRIVVRRYLQWLQDFFFKVTRTCFTYQNFNINFFAVCFLARKGYWQIVVLFYIVSSRIKKILFRTNFLTQEFCFVQHNFV